jgi:ribosomal-protein-alanine N-acetyltransferase
MVDFRRAPCSLSSGPGFFIRSMTGADLEPVAAIESENPAPWTAGQLADEFDQEGAWQFVAQASASGEVCGFVCGRSCAGEAELLKIAVARQYRRQGIAGRLLGHALYALAEQGVASCFLELRAANLPALALYERFGFRRTGLRKDYYVAPPEDAIVMGKTLLPAQKKFEGNTP